ncbi:DinB family protein [Flavobacteriaceae bacterium 3-367]|uniref:DinB family protein n=1 Tax=Eudoraea algarum TaxID=3417568 RepID=UPI003291AA23
MRKSELEVYEFEQFYTTYLNALEADVELMPSLSLGMDDFLAFMEAIPDEKLPYAYSEGKWTLAEVLVHIIDAERVFQYRAFRFSRNDRTPLAGFEQNGYIQESNAGKRSKEDLIAEYTLVRKCTLAVFDGLDVEKLKRGGIASEIPWTVGGLGFVICGHQEHHRKIIAERYL